MRWLRRLRARRVFRRAQRAARRGAFARAVSGFRRAQRLDPRFAYPAVHEALALTELGRVDEALAAARRAVALAPRNAAVRIFAGRVHYDADDLAAARAHFETALELNPENDLARGYCVLTRWTAGEAEAWRELAPAEMPDSNAFLVRWLERVEVELRPGLRGATPADRPAGRNYGRGPCRVPAPRRFSPVRAEGRR